jgi:Tol biopolymer transport system component
MRTAAVLVVALIAAGACSAESNEAGSPRAAKQAAPPRERLELAVSRVVTGDPPRRDIVVLDTAGATLRELTRNAAPVFHGRGAWSPDGRRFAFGGSDAKPAFAESNSDIFVVDATGANQRRLTNSGAAFAPVWSPVGDTIVFAEYAGAGLSAMAALWAIDSEGGRKRRLVEGERGRLDIPSSFTPDGSQLAFTRLTRTERGPDGRVQDTSEVMLLDMESLAVRKVIDRAADAAYSPDGRRIAFVSDRDENGELSYGDAVFDANELYVLDVESGDVRRLTQTRDLNERSPSWSPDGELIAYQRGEVTGNAEGTIVLTTRSDGTCIRRVAHDPGLGVWYSGPVWRPGMPSNTAHLMCRADVRPSLAPLSGNLSLAEARRFRPFRLYWLGRRFQEQVLSSIGRSQMSAPGGRGPVVSLHYGAIQIQLWAACVRVPAHVDLIPDKRTRVRGVQAVFFEDGNRMEIVTGRTTIVVFAAARRMLRISRALEPLNVARAPKRGASLPPPVKGAVAGNLAC